MPFLAWPLVGAHIIDGISDHSQVNDNVSVYSSTNDRYEILTQHFVLKTKASCAVTIHVQFYLPFTEVI